MELKNGCISNPISLSEFNIYVLFTQSVHTPVNTGATPRPVVTCSQGSPGGRAGNDPGTRRAMPGRPV